MLDPLGLRTELFWVVPSKYIFSRLETLPVHPPYPGRGRRRKTFHVQNFWEIFPFWPQQSGNSEVIFWPVFTLFASLIRKSAAEDERRSRQTPVTALFSLMHHGSFSLPSHTRYNLESPAWVRSDPVDKCWQRYPSCESRLLIYMQRAMYEITLTWNTNRVNQCGMEVGVISGSMSQDATTSAKKWINK